MLSPFLCVKGLFKACKINRVVTVNNSVLSTNLYPDLSEKQIEKAHHFLKKKYPTHLIIFRSLNTYSEETLTRKLTDLRYKMITCRSVYFFDPEKFNAISQKKRWIIKKDLCLLDQEGIKVVKHEEFLESDIPQIKKLYDLLYLEKYSRLNPQFTEIFFKEALMGATFKLSGIRFKGKLVGVIGYFKEKEIMATPIVGYDTSLPSSLGLYRMLTALMIKESMESKLLFHMSSGVGHFKRQRGGSQVIESLGVYMQHLPFYRRLPWYLLSLLFNRIAKNILLKKKL